MHSELDAGSPLDFDVPSLAGLLGYWFVGVADHQLHCRCDSCKKFLKYV